jgi:MGT family glycosyltransferase
LARIVVLSVPAYGHLNPVLPIARLLVQRGHEVTIFNEASFRGLIEPTGARFAAYPPVIHLEDFSRTLKDGDMIAWIEMIFRATGRLLGATFAALRDNPPDLIVYDGVAIWGEMLAAKLRLPSVAISTTFTSDAMPRDFGRFVRDTASIVPRLPGFIAGASSIARHGLLQFPRTLPLVPRRGSLTLMLTSREFHPPSRWKSHPRIEFVGCSIDPSTRLESFDFSRLDGRPLIYVSLGTLHHGNHAFFANCIEAFRDYPGQVLLSVGRGTDLGAFAGAPPNFIFAEAVPQLAVLGRTHIFVTHGGLNSVHEGLWEGVPMVAVPQQIEQFYNARAMERAGAGVVIEGQEGVADAQALRAAVDRVSADHANFAEAARRMGDTLRAGGGYVTAADRIEEMAGHSGAVQAGSAKTFASNGATAP